MRKPLFLAHKPESPLACEDFAKRWKRRLGVL